MLPSTLEVYIGECLSKRGKENESLKSTKEENIVVLWMVDHSYKDLSIHGSSST